MKFGFISPTHEERKKKREKKRKKESGAFGTKLLHIRAQQLSAVPDGKTKLYILVGVVGFCCFSCSFFFCFFNVDLFLFIRCCFLTLKRLSFVKM